MDGGTIWSLGGGGGGGTTWSRAGKRKEKGSARREFCHKRGAHKAIDTLIHILLVAGKVGAATAVVCRTVEAKSLALLMSNIKLSNTNPRNAVPARNGLNGMVT